MELLYFISGILSVGIAYSIVLLKKNQSNYHDALARLQHHQNISSIRNSEYKEKIDELEELTKDIQSKLEKDQYESIAGINKDLQDLNDRFNGLDESVGIAAVTNEKNFGTLFTELGQVKQTVKVMSQDPNFTRTF